MRKLPNLMFSTDFVAYAEQVCEIGSKPPAVFNPGFFFLMVKWKTRKRRIICYVRVDLWFLSTGQTGYNQKTIAAPRCAPIRFKKCISRAKRC
jgi:hypothetical protein